MEYSLAQANESPGLSDHPQALSHVQLGRSLRLVAHELRAPLTTLRLAIQLGYSRWRRGGPVDAATFEKALSQVDELTAVIAELCDAGRIASGDFELALKVVDIVDLLRTGTERYSRENSTHLVSFDGPSGVANILGDERCMNRVLALLLDNATKFSPPPAVIKVSTIVQDHAVLFSVTDRGIGVLFADQERIFDMFYRAGNASSLNAQGLGLGLFIARQLVSNHGGRIWYTPVPDGGSAFNISLPRFRADG